MANDDRIAALELHVQRMQRKLEFLFQTLNIADPDGGPDRNDPLVAAVKDLLLKGQKLQAITLYRRETGAALADAMRAVELIAASV